MFGLVRGVCTENLNTGVVVVKSAQDGAWTEHIGSLNRARNRRILVQGSMRSDVAVIVRIGSQDLARVTQPKTMMWSRHSRRIDPISRSAKPFCQGEAGAGGLPRVPMARYRRVTTSPPIDPAAIADEVVRSLIPRKCLRDLTRDPLRCRIGCDADRDEVPAIR